MQGVASAISVNGSASVALLPHTHLFERCSFAPGLLLLAAFTDHLNRGARLHLLVDDYVRALSIGSNFPRHDVRRQQPSEGVIIVLSASAGDVLANQK